MEEQHSVWKIIVVVDDVRQIHHCLTPFVFRDTYGGEEIVEVDGIYGFVERGQLLSYLGNTVLLHPAHDEHSCVGRSGRFRCTREEDRRFRDAGDEWTTMFVLSRAVEQYESEDDEKYQVFAKTYSQGRKVSYFEIPMTENSILDP